MNKNDWEDLGALIRDVDLSILAYAQAEVSAAPSVAFEALAAPTYTECWSADEENYNCTSLGELLDNNGHLIVGSIVWRGEAHVPATSRLIDAEDVVCVMADRASDIAGEYADGYPCATTQARAELEAFLDTWVARHCPPTFYEVKNSKPYTLTADDLPHPEAP